MPPQSSGYKFDGEHPRGNLWIRKIFYPEVALTPQELPDRPILEAILKMIRPAEGKTYTTSVLSMFEATTIKDPAVRLWVTAYVWGSYHKDAGQVKPRSREGRKETERSRTLRTHDRSSRSVAVHGNRPAWRTEVANQPAMGVAKRPKWPTRNLLDDSETSPSGPSNLPPCLDTILPSPPQYHQSSISDIQTPTIPSAATHSHLSDNPLQPSQTPTIPSAATPSHLSGMVGPSGQGSRGQKRKSCSCSEPLDGWSQGIAKLNVQFNELHQPIGPDQAKLSTQLGVMVKNGFKFPLTCTTWKHPDLNDEKEKAWNLVKANINGNVPEQYKPQARGAHFNIPQARVESEGRVLSTEKLQDNARPTLPPLGARANAPARATKFNPPTPAGQSNTTARGAHYKTSHAPAVVESHSSSSCASRLCNNNDQVGTSSNQLVNVYSTSKPPTVVAIGIVTSKEPSKLVYGVRLGPEYWEVEIKKVLKPYFKLARPFANQTVAWISTYVKFFSVKTLNEAGK